MATAGKTIILPSGKRGVLASGKAAVFNGDGLCPECCEGCEQFADNFNRSNSTNIGSDWSEEAGNWSIASNTLRASAGGAIATCQASLTLPYTIFCKVRGTSSSDSAKIIWNYTDSNNYSYLHITFDAAQRWRLFEVSGGTPTELDNEPVSDTANNTDLYIAVCVTAESAIVNLSLSGVADSYSFAIAAETDSALSECGVGTTTQGGTISFDDWQVDTHNSSDSACFKCVSECSRCVDGIAPERWKVVISGITGAGVCTDFNGTFILHPTKSACVWSSGDLDFEIDGTCSPFSSVSLRLESARPDAPPVGCSDSGTHNYAIKIRCAYGTSTVCTDSGCFSTFRHTQAALYDCLNITNLDVPDYASPPYCTASSATCTVTAL